MSCNGAEEVGASTEDVGEHRQGIHACDEQTKLRLANEIVEAINHCLLDKMAKTSTSEGHLSPSPIAAISESANGQAATTADKKFGNALEWGEFGDAAEHSSSIREFKRLGAYCTLRPEQRRKHLLKALPTLRNSRILQTLLATADSTQANTGTDATSSANKHVIDNLLSNLDHIIGGESSRSASTLAGECNGDGRLLADGGESKSAAQLDPKIEDCLRELDVYLEEIDRDYAMACAYGSSVTPNYSKAAQRTMESDESLKLLDNMETVDDEYSERKNGSGTATGAAAVADGNVQTQRFSSDSHMMRTLSSSDTNINQCDTTMNGLLCKENADRISEASNNGACSSGSHAMKRGHRTRNTIGGGGGGGVNGKMARSNQLHRSSGTRDASKRSSNWRRSSMRKTKPIILPQTEEDSRPPEINRMQFESESTPAPDESFAVSADEQTPNETQLSYFPLDNDVSFEPFETTPAAPIETQAADLHSLNNEFLTTILTSPHATCEENAVETTHSPECRTMLNECNVNGEIARPRQMGRRSEVRSRIVSITAERNAAGNQVSPD